LKTPPKKTTPKKSVKTAAKEESFQKGLRLLKEAKSIDDPALKELAQKAAIQICIRDAVVPLDRNVLLRSVVIACVIEAAICILALLILPGWAASGIVVVTGGIWLILVAVCLSLGNVISETILAKLMTTVFGKMMEKIFFWSQNKSPSDQDE
jgi:hypothetical protein